MARKVKESTRLLKGHQYAAQITDDAFPVSLLNACLAEEDEVERIVLFFFLLALLVSAEVRARHISRAAIFTDISIDSIFARIIPVARRERLGTNARNISFYQMKKKKKNHAYA